MDMFAVYAPAPQKLPEILQDQKTFQKRFPGHLSGGKHIPPQGHRLSRPVHHPPQTAGAYFRHQQPDTGGTNFYNSDKTAFHENLIIGG
jgi:hypothetical protein